MALTESERKQEKKEKPLTKVVIRRLPPTIDKDTFLKQVSPLPDYNYIYTVNGDFSLGEFAFSRVYINFVNHEDIYDFKERFDNYVFLDNKGNEYPCVVEFAPFQKIPKKRGKTRIDPKSGSIESDPIYTEFVESLQKPVEPVEEKPEYTLQLTNENKNDVTTPLLEFIKNKKAQRMRIREVRREERKRREFDKRKDRFVEDRKRVNDEKSPATNPEIRPKPKVDNSKAEGESETKVEEKSEKVYEKSYYKSRERKYEERRFEDRRKDIKPRYPKKDYYDNRDYKYDDHKEKETRSKTDYRKEVETKVFPKKVKKYSEKREERKIEAQKAEQKKINQALNETQADTQKPPQADTQKPPQEKPGISNEKKEPPKPKVEKDVKKEEPDVQSQKRIRNKDRPTIAIYRPGMLSKRRQNETEGNESKDNKSDEKL
ncbi:UPF3 regulator of nonsense mediated mRNA decay [Leptinotarsa decemlineata]|uniref:UPF3 regulator of nonsense mediated mRNA decay n=1 Tax=Leptinotarsa decemlineata TaxID=7539 RepID=UPI000C251E56|nr:regulator of nonsense transcripts 3B [Leptinotarsa decemlineata]